MTKDDEPQEPKPISTPGIAFKDVIFEQINDRTFLIYDRTTKNVATMQLIIHDAEQYVPLLRIPWLTCGTPVEDNCITELATKEKLHEALTRQQFQGDYENELSLFNEIRQFFVDHLDVQNELLYDVYTTFVLMTWRLEDFKVVPYQFFLGPLASGKTRALECFKFLGYRGLMASSMTAATIFRSIEAWHCLLLLDESEIYNRESMIEVLALLNTGYRRGQFAIRIERLVKDGPPELGMFDVFGPKVIAGTEELKNTLQSRCIPTAMSKNVRHINLFVDEVRAQELRNKLLTYRFRNLGQKSEFDVTVLNGFFQNARVIELFWSLLEVAPSQEIRDRLIQCMKGITQSRLDEEQASIEARVFDAILKSVTYVESGKISTQAITETYNVGLPENDKATSRFIGRKVTALGFEKCRLSGGPSGYYWNETLIERLRQRYFPSGSKTTSQTSQSSQTSLDTVKTDETAIVGHEVSEDKPSLLEDHSSGEKTVNSEVSEQSEESEGSLEALAIKTLKLERLTGLYEDKCVSCGKSGRMDFQITEHDGSWAFLCANCGLQLQKKLGKNGC